MTESWCPHVRSASRRGSNCSCCSACSAPSGLPCIEDPDAAVLLRADGEAAARAKLFLDLGIGPEDTVAVMRVLVESLDHAAAIMREAGLKAVLRPGSTEIELAEGTRTAGA